MPDRDRDIPQGGDAGTARPLLRHLFRVLAFDAIWVILPLGVDLLLVWLAPAPDQSPAYALVYIPLEYLSALILTAPVSAFIGSLVWIVAERWSWALRQGAVGISIVAWAVGAILLF